MVRNFTPELRVRFQYIMSVLTCAFVVAMLATPVPAAVEAGPQELIKTTIEELRLAISAQKQQVETDPNVAVQLVNSILSPKVDTGKFGKLVLGRHWPEASESQRTRFVNAYRQLLLRTYAVHASDYTDVKVDFLPLRTSGDNSAQATVRTVVSRGGKPPINVNYRLHQTSSGWKVYDVTADNISLVATFRATIDSEIQQQGLDGMIAALEKKNNEPFARR